MQVILTSIDKPVKCEYIPNGKIELQELKVWPGWTHSKFKTILTYRIGDDDFALKVAMGKNYTFDVLAQEISDTLNLGGEQVCVLYHNNGRVMWRVYPPPKHKNPKLSAGMMAFLRPNDIKLSDDVVKLFKLDGVQADKHGIMTGAPVDKASISFCFSDASTLFFTCDECDQTTLVDEQKTNAITAIPVAAAIDGSLTASLIRSATLAFTDNYTNRFTFHVRDEIGNNLPIKRLFCRLIINK